MPAEVTDTIKFVPITKIDQTLTSFNPHISCLQLNANKFQKLF